MSLSRFKGCLVGAVVADCIGAMFEGMSVVKLKQLLDVVDQNIENARKIHKETGSKPASVNGLPFTDDTAMARSVAASLINMGEFDARDMAKRFGSEFKAEPDRGYGGNVVTVLEAFDDATLEDVFQPASQQFDGSGSYGNGGAMRVSPVPLFTYFDNDVSKLQKVTTDVTRLTHTHLQAIHGTLLEAMAVDQALRLQKGKDLDVIKFLDELIAKMRPIEEGGHEEEEGEEGPPRKKIAPKRRLDADPTPYCAKLEKIKEFAFKKDLKASEVEEVLGNDVSALGSVPAAVLSFVRQSVMVEPGLETRNQFSRTVLYAITLGGDTDTIATMAAAMAGAMCGVEEVPESWMYYCEGVGEAEGHAEALFSRGGKHAGEDSEENSATKEEQSETLK